MTDYSNPKIPEGINVSSEHPLKDFFIMLLGVGMLLTLAIVLLAVFAQSLVRFIPFEVEQALVGNAEQWQMELPDAQGTADAGLAPSSDAERHHARVQEYLQQLGERLLATLDDPLPVQVHYLDDDMVNAFATLGGQVFITRGLLDILPDENSLAMVLAHEIAHVQHRDPIVALGRGLTVGLALMSVTGNGDGAVAHQLLEQVNLLVDLRFSRDAETAADAAALESLLQLYGHLGSADQLFRYLRQREGDEAFDWYSTHPLNEKRIAAIARFAAAHQRDVTAITPLPRWLSDPEYID